MEKCAASIKCDKLDWVTQKPLKGVKIQKTTQSGEMVSNRIHLVLERMGSLVAL